MNTIKPSQLLSNTWNQHAKQWQQTDQSQIAYDGGLYAFTNRQRNKIKRLYWEDNIE